MIDAGDSSINGFEYPRKGKAFWELEDTTSFFTFHLVGNFLTKNYLD